MSEGPCNDPAVRLIVGVREPCPECDGEGVIGDNPCPECRGFGYVDVYQEHDAT